MTGSFPALAATGGQPLNFDKPLGERAQLLIENFAQQTLKTEPGKLEVAPADLNEDGLDEFIVRNGEEYRILAESDNKVVELGDLRAFSLLLGNSYSNGVRNLLARQSPDNDFEYKLYVWEPMQARYILSE